MTEMEFALLFGVTIRTVELWETDAVVPSRITAMVIRAESERAREAAEASASGALGERPPARHSRRAATRGAPRRTRRRA